MMVDRAEEIQKLKERLIALEGTIKWMRWCWITLGTIVATILASLATGAATRLVEVLL